MRIFIACVFICSLLFSCHSGKQTDVETASLPIEQDSIAEDSTETDELWEEAMEEYGRNDEYFHDFIYSFSANEKFQRSRTVFPLPLVQNSVNKMIERKNWKYVPLHPDDDIYTVVFNDLNGMDIEKDASIDSVTIGRMDFMEESIQCYSFNKKGGHWNLRNIVQTSIAEYKDNEFLTFFHQFAADSLFQYNHVSSMVQFSTSDMENGFEQMSGTLEKSQWTFFCPYLPKEDLYIIDYGQPLQNDKYRLLTLQGRSNGNVNMLFFKKTHEGWMLYRFEN